MDDEQESIDRQGNDRESGRKKTSRRVRGLVSLSAIRKELVKIYSELRASKPDPETVQYFRALAFILNTAAGVRKDEALEAFEARLDMLEQRSREA